MLAFAVVLSVLVMLCLLPMKTKDSIRMKGYFVWKDTEWKKTAVELNSEYQKTSYLLQKGNDTIEGEVILPDETVVDVVGTFDKDYSPYAVSVSHDESPILRASCVSENMQEVVLFVNVSQDIREQYQVPKKVIFITTLEDNIDVEAYLQNIFKDFPKLKEVMKEYSK